MSDDALIEAMAKAMSESGNKDWMYAEDWLKDIYIGQAIAALAVCRPIIEKQEREKCALECDLERRCIPSVEDEYLRGYGTALRHMAETMRGGRAAAIRENGND